MAALPTVSAELVFGRTFTNVAPCSPLHSSVVHVTMGWFQPEYLAEEPSVRWTLAGPRVPRSAFTLYQATGNFSQLCAIRHGSGHV